MFLTNGANQTRFAEKARVLPSFLEALAAVRSSLERRLKEDTEALAKRHAEELARDAEEDAVELEKAVSAAIKSQNEK